MPIDLFIILLVCCMCICELNKTLLLEMNERMFFRLSVPVSSCTPRSRAFCWPDRGS